MKIRQSNLQHFTWKESLTNGVTIHWSQSSHFICWFHKETYRVLWWEGCRVQLQELAQLKQTRLVDSYITEFQSLTTLVIDILKSRLVVLFMDGLMETLRAHLVVGISKWCICLISGICQMLDLLIRNWVLLRGKNENSNFSNSISWGGINKSSFQTKMEI